MHRYIFPFISWPPQLPFCLFKVKCTSLYNLLYAPTLWSSAAEQSWASLIGDVVKSRNSPRCCHSHPSGLYQWGEVNFLWTASDWLSFFKSVIVKCKSRLTFNLESAEKFRLQAVMCVSLVYGVFFHKQRTWFFYSISLHDKELVTERSGPRIRDWACWHKNTGLDLKNIENKNIKLKTGQHITHTTQYRTTTCDLKQWFSILGIMLICKTWEDLMSVH